MRVCAAAVQRCLTACIPGLCWTKNSPLEPPSLLGDICVRLRGAFTEICRRVFIIREPHKTSQLPSTVPPHLQNCPLLLCDVFNRCGLFYLSLKKCSQREKKNAYNYVNLKGFGCVRSTDGGFQWVDVNAWRVLPCSHYMGLYQKNIKRWFLLNFQASVNKTNLYI